MQESAPEQLDLKRRLLADIAAATPEHVVIGSSTSGFGMTEMAVDTASAHRLVVAHPFNPPYLIPLVEVVGGERTAADVVKWTAEFFRHIGKSVITLDREVPGFIANRLQEALWREALHMVANGEATVEQIDASITEGPGLRWAFHGPMLTFHLAGGPGGMAHMLDHFGPSLLSPWTRLAAPELTPELRDAVVRGCEEEAGSRTIADLVRERDRRLVDLLRVLGKAPDGSELAVTWTEDVRPEWIDYNGHLSEAYYVLVFGHATDAVMARLGMTPGVPDRHRHLALHAGGARPLPRPGAARAPGWRCGRR